MRAAAAPRATHLVAFPPYALRSRQRRAYRVLLAADDGPLRRGRAVGVRDGFRLRRARVDVALRLADRVDSQSAAGAGRGRGAESRGSRANAGASISPRAQRPR